MWNLVNKRESEREKEYVTTFFCYLEGQLDFYFMEEMFFDVLCSLVVTVAVVVLVQMEEDRVDCWTQEEPDIVLAVLNLCWLRNTEFCNVRFHLSAVSRNLVNHINWIVVVTVE